MARVQRMAVWLIAAALLGLMPAVLRAQPGAPPDGTPPAAPASPPAAGEFGSGAFGVDLATPEHPAGSAARPSTVALIGAGWVRIIADWSVLEPARGRYAWVGLDAEIREATASGERVLVLLENTPRWAALTPDTPPSVWSHQPPRQVADWTAFVTAVASRYRGKVAAWQVEPSIEFPTFRGTGLDYEQMLYAASAAVRRAHPRALVVAASPAGLDLAYMKTLLARSGRDVDAIMLYPRGRTPEDLLEAIAVIRARILTDGRHELWLSALPEWGAEPQMIIAALAGGVSRQFWPRLDPMLTTAIRLVGGARLVGPLNRGPGVFAFVFSNGATPLAALWSTGAARSVPLATTGAPALFTASGQVASPGPGGDQAAVPVGADPVFVSNPARSVVDEADQTARQGGFAVPRPPDRDFSKVESVSAALGATNVEHGLYNQRLRTLGGGGVIPVSVEGAEAVRSDASRNVDYVYFDVDHSFAFFDDGRYDLLITVEVHRASAAQLVGFNLYYDSMSGYRFTPWQWVEAGSGWATYTVRLRDADFSSTWGWDFALNAAGDKKENLVVRSVTVTKGPAGTQ